MEDTLEEVHEELLVWAEGLGVKMHGIRPMRLSGRGFGIVATDHIAQGTEVLTVPSSALRTSATVPSTITKHLPKDMSAHGLLAADLALNLTANSKKYGKWDAVVPSWHDMQQYMPLTWPAILQSFLPPAAQDIFNKQRKNFDRDWTLISQAFPFPTKGEIRPSCKRDDYLYAWLLVNTRTFYYVTPQTKKLPKEDHMALQPVADLFNHVDKDGCTVLYHHADSYSFTTTKSYDKGDEVHISYGAHPNDFLLIEYGFLLDNNVWDEVRIDEAVLPSLSQLQKDELEDVGYRGKYVLDKDTVCHRTQVALRLMLTDRCGGLTMDQWQDFVDGVNDGEDSRERVDAALVSLLQDFASQVTDKVSELQGLKFEAGTEAPNEARRDMLLMRWEQISSLIRNTVERLK